VTAYGNCVPRLEVYPTVILQLTTIGLLFSFSSSAAAVLPALTAPAVELSEDGAVLVHDAEIKSEPKEVKSEDYMPITDSKNVEKFVRDYFKDIPLLAEIAKCESRFRQYDSRGEVLRGEKNTYDRGVMQINILYHAKSAQKMGLDIYDLDDNVAYARHLYEEQGSKPWKSSKACWGKYAGAEIAINK
jgi:hypothetical protein